MFFTKHIILTIKDNISANGIDNHIPFIPINSGNIKIQIIWNINVLKKDISADINPSLSAVKNEDAYMLNQLMIYDNEYNLNALIVRFNNSLL